MNRIAPVASMYATGYVADYIGYYERSVVPLSQLLAAVEHDPDFEFVSQDIRPFIYHERWRWKRGDVEMTFRRVDEEQLQTYNDSFDGIDEVVLHPDGLLTGSWERDRKILDIPEAA